MKIFTPFRSALRFKTMLPLTAACVTAALLGAPAQSQTVQDDSVPETSLSVPDGQKVFGENNPNVRRATAIVNGQIITGTDIDERLALILDANKNVPAPEELQRLRLQVLRNLIDETLQIQEAIAQEIPIEEAEINATYARVAQQNFGQDAAAMDRYLVKIGSSPYSLKRQILGELSWQRLIRRNITPFVNVSEEEVKEVLERLEASKGQDEYRIGEIYLSATQENAEQVAQNVVKIMEQLQQGGSFPAYARQFSEASSAAQGGDLGWLQLAQLPQQIADAARQMSVGQLQPVETPGGYSIVFLIDQRKILTADPRDALLSLKQLAISFPAGTTEQQATQRAAAFSEATKQIRGCGDADRIAASLGASVVDNDEVSLRTLPQALQSTVSQMSIGESTPPFGSIEQGVRVLVLCGRDDPKVASGPTAEQLESSMEDRMINKRAQKYLRDLRRDAIIDYN